MVCRGTNYWANAERNDSDRRKIGGFGEGRLVVSLLDGTEVECLIKGSKNKPVGVSFITLAGLLSCLNRFMEYFVDDYLCKLYNEINIGKSRR